MAISDKLNISIANITVGVECNDRDFLDGLKQKYDAFISQKKADFYAHFNIVDSDQVDNLKFLNYIFHEDRIEFRHLGYEGIIDFNHSLARLEVAKPITRWGCEYFLRIIYTYLIFLKGGLMMHAAGVLRDGNVYIFFGHSGAGKTTVARASQKVGMVLNDDLIALLPYQGEWKVYSTPFWNPSQVRPNNGSGTLNGLYRLIQDKSVFLESIDQGKALAEIISCMPIIALDHCRNSFLVSRCNGLREQVGVQYLHFLPDDSFWPIVLPDYQNCIERTLENS